MVDYLLDSPVLRSLEPFDADRTERFEAFVAGLRPVFQRADQFLRCRAYLRGLLEPGDRKNFEGIAAAAERHIMVEQDLPQALQHFVSSSPWDGGRLIAAVRDQRFPQRAEAVSLYVVNETACVKKGRHSVGVQRQFARSLGQKINCQIGIFVSQVVGEDFFPLAVRLYLPTNWLRDNSKLAERLIPEAERQTLPKPAIARKLLGELLDAGEPIQRLASDGGHRELEGFTDWLGEQGIDVETHDLGEPAAHFDRIMSELGLDHYEGRSWIGWHHHVALVMTAYSFLMAEANL